MARIVDLNQAQRLSGQLRAWAYNALDATGTREIFNILRPQLDADHVHIYEFHKAIQAPAVAMSLRGVRVDVAANKAAQKELRKEQRAVQKAINKHPQVAEVWDGLEKVTGACKLSKRKDGKHTWQKGVPDSPERLCEQCGSARFKVSEFNPNSSDQTDHLLHDLHGLPRFKNKQKKESVDEDTLDRIRTKFPKYDDLISKIIQARGLKKQLGFLKTKLSPDNRFMSTFNVAAPWTARFSSSKDPWQQGGNLQNVAPRHRFQFIADPGMELAYIDLSQAESNLVAHISGDEKYIEAHRVGDVHTYVTRLVWPQLPWTGDLAKDKKIAKQNPPWDLAPGHNYRFQSKRIQHGSNYGLTPYGIAMIAHLPLRETEKAQRQYYREFQFIRGYQEWNARQIAEGEPLINPLGFKVRLMGKPDETHTRNQGLSFPAQSGVAMIINIALWRVWQELDPHALQLLAQVHDALLFQFPKGKLDIPRRVAQLMRFPVTVTDYRGNTRQTIIGVEAKVGDNWGNHDPEKNPYGMKVLEV